MTIPKNQFAAVRGAPTLADPLSRSSFGQNQPPADLQYLDTRIRKLQAQLPFISDPLHRGFASIELRDLREQFDDRYRQHLRQRTATVAPSLPPALEIDAAAALIVLNGEPVRLHPRPRQPVHRKLVARATQIGLRRAMAELSRSID